MFFFFFSSRRRHTRWPRDWSSDVCSSDLIGALLEEVTRIHPVVLCFDDVHWADPSTTDLIGYLARRIDNMRLLIIATCRPSELAQTKHPFLPMKLDLVSHGVCREISPGHFDEAAINRYLALQFADHAFP